ncbi:hypothetical protein MAR_016362 [Mya arenaria]|uniref:Uncharacterized protein n=1 Tax=Mya arenaria TaxID=6604 RepID=A0ABY7FNW9_MYAAR|nr:hypothetical protein MAR_016362 [Mya arenaria]
MSCLKTCILFAFVINLKAAMSETETAGKFWHELYYVLPFINGKPRYIPDINYFLRFSATDDPNVYKIDTKGDIPSVDQGRLICVQRPEFAVLSNPIMNAEFSLRKTVNGPNSRSLVVWSSDPEHFFWTMRCREEGHPNNSTCNIDQTDMALFVSGTPNDLNWPLVLEDIAKTNITFADRAYKWFYAYSETSRCID